MTNYNLKNPIKVIAPIRFSIDFFFRKEIRKDIFKTYNKNNDNPFSFNFGFESTDFCPR